MNNVCVNAVLVNGRSSFPVFIIICIFLLAGCAAFKQPQGIHQFSDKAVLLDLPFMSQKSPTLCGLASAEMLTGYYGIPLNDVQRQSLSGEAEKNQGISGAVLKAALEQAGYFVAVFPGTLDREPTGIYRHLDSHRPLIVMLRGGEGKSGHYALLTGYDPERDLVALLDPARGR